MDYYRHLRALQSHFPQLLTAKTIAQRHFRLAMKKPFESDFFVLKHFNKRGGVFLDIGANRGQSIDAIRMFAEDPNIIAFEPNSNLAQVLTKRWSKQPGIKIEACGLSTSASDLTLFVPEYNGFVYDGLASFDRMEALSWLNADTLAGFRADKLKVTELNCPVETLDSFDLIPDFIKIDVQGFERPVLEGGKQMILDHHPLIMLENNPSADEFLIGLGLKRYAFDDDMLIEGKTGELNTFYATQSTLEKWPSLKVSSTV